MSWKGRRSQRVIGLGLLVIVAYLPGASPDPGSAGPASAPPAGDDTPSAAQRCFHVVLRGESLGRVAARYGTLRGTLIRANHLAPTDALLVGRRLEVPRCAPGLRVSAMTSSSEAVRDAFSTRAPSRSVRSVASTRERLVFVWPVEGRVISGFGRRGFRGWHQGVDIKADQGQPIRAAAPGTVSFSGWQSNYGRIVTVAHANGFSTLYAHNLRNFVRAGDRVEAGTPIAAVGRTGRATVQHLHFEIHRKGLPQNPLVLLDGREPARMLAKSD